MKMLSRRSALLGAVAILFLIGFGWVVANQGPLAAIKVTIAGARETTLQRTLFGIGTLEARRSYAVGPTVAGRVAAVRVDQGDVVHAGQLLAEMDPVDLESRQAASGAAAARAAQLVFSAQAALAEAASRAQMAQANAARFASLRSRNFVSQEAADTKAHEAAAAHAGRDSATAALAAAREEARRAQSDREGLGKSRAHLRLTSPVNGVVSARLAEPGSTVVAGQSVVQVIDPASLWLRVRIDQGRSVGLAVGLAADIVLRSYPGQVLKGRVERVDMVGDAVAEERIANISIGQAPGNLAIGELAEVTLHLPSLGGVLAVPAAAVKRLGRDEGVWRIENGRAEFSRVTTGITSSDGMTQVRNGLTAGDNVIVHSEKVLSAGVRVKTVDALVQSAP
ncbi:MAG: efflux RND transporter periplasmic adaptor subunit [Propionivibrio sp.]